MPETVTTFDFTPDGPEETLVTGQIRADLSMLVGLEAELREIPLPVSIVCRQEYKTVTMTISSLEFSGFMGGALFLPVVYNYTLSAIVLLLPHLQRDTRMLILESLHKQLQCRWVLFGRVVTARDDFLAVEKRLAGVGAEPKTNWQRHMSVRVKRSPGEPYIAVAWSHIRDEEDLERWLKFAGAATATLELYEELKGEALPE
jgi:hypothetical protein